jgi:hypothetical protein
VIGNPLNSKTVTYVAYSSYVYDVTTTDTASGTTPVPELSTWGRCWSPASPASALRVIAASARPHSPGSKAPGSRINHLGGTAFDLDDRQASLIGSVGPKAEHAVGAAEA